ncbi:S1 RNA-binding domain-containing protein, partial [Patescibacteria group bacterium]
DRELSASEAERASKKYKQVEYMQEHVGETFEGTISGVTEWGVYVEEVNTKCEGMIKLRELGDDFYTLDEKNYAIVGEKSKKRFQLGDTIKFKVVSADLDRKTLDYSLVK